MNAVTVTNHEVMIQPEQVELIRRTVAKDATQDELELYFYDCRRQGVHPLDKLIHFTKRGGRYVPITSIDFLRMKSGETGAYAGSDDAVFDGKPGLPGFAAKVGVYRIVQGQRCAWTATARWEEYYPGDSSGSMWRKMPHVMLAKCAEALALRKAFADVLHGLYIREEMDQAEQTKDTRSLSAKIQAKVVEVMPPPTPTEEPRQEDGLDAKASESDTLDTGSQDAPAPIDPIIWNAGTAPPKGHRGKDIREVPTSYLEWYMNHGPQDEYRDKAREELDRRKAEDLFNEA